MSLTSHRGYVEKTLDYNAPEEKSEVKFLEMYILNIIV